MPKELLKKFFQRIEGGKRFQIRQELKNGIVWQQQHLLMKPPDSVYDIIFLRNNLLTYYRSKLQTSALRPILTCLASGGLLIVGAHESLPNQLNELEAPAVLPYVFQKRWRCENGGC
jgi:chemotaxis protein methyltransferase CheR